jgi:FkbM family methyltransferase
MNVNTFPSSGDRVIEWNGRTLYYPEQMEACFLPVLHGEYIAPALPDEPTVDTVLDIGAACGGFALWALKRWPGCRVVCIEPDPAMRWYLEANVPEATIIHAAVTWSCGRGLLHLGPEGHRGFNAMSPDEVGYKWHERTIEVDTISALVLPQADVVKCDAEGAERPLMAIYPHWDRAWWSLFEWHAQRLRKTCERTMEHHRMSMVHAVTQDRDMGTQTWCRTRARMHRRGVWEWRLPGE